MKCFQSIILLTLLIPAIRGQETVPTIYLPIVPVLAEYEFAPQYFSQWIKHPNYSLIEAISNKDGTIWQIILTETETRKRVVYTNSKTQFEYLKKEGKEVYLTNIDFKKTQEAGEQPFFGFAFADKTGQPIFWRINYASTPSERGAGLTPLASAPGLRLDYRNLGTAVGEGTAIQIGSQVIEAELWKEISSPPYFVAYRGSVTLGKHIGTLLLGTEKWEVIKKPKKLEKGETWKLTDEKGRQRILQISDFYPDSQEIIVDEVNSGLSDASLIRLVIHLTPAGFALRAFEIKSKTEDMRIKFEPELPIHVSDSANFESTFTISQGKNKNVAGGKIIGSREKDSYTKLKWQFGSPDWSKAKTLESLIKFEAKGYSIETK
jgi:hypothetical protein